MTFAEYIAAKRQQLDIFERDYLARRQAGIQDDWPLEMGSADWDEQFHFLTPLPGAD